MTHYVKAWILALGLILTPAAVFAQDTLPAAPDVDAATVIEDDAGDVDTATAATPAPETASGLDPALYTPMKPTPGVGMPVDGGLDFQPQVSPTGEQAKWINNAILLPLMAVVCLLVLVLLFVVMIRYRRRANPEASKTTHNTFIEVIWTVIPVLILLVIAVPSISLLAKQFEPAPEGSLTIKVTGYQWYWGYSYPDNGGFEVISNMLPDDEAIARGETPLLAVDNRMVIPVGQPVKLLVTGADVIHSFAIPSAWFKLDAVPGRINEKVLQIDKVGVYYGQCSELCGVRHGYMPIAVEVLPQDKFNDWVRANGGTVSGDESAEAEGSEAADNAAASDDVTTQAAPADAAAATN